MSRNGGIVSESLQAIVIDEPILFESLQGQFNITLRMNDTPQGDSESIEIKTRRISKSIRF